MKGGESPEERQISEEDWAAGVPKSKEKRSLRSEQLSTKKLRRRWWWWWWQRRRRSTRRRRRQRRRPCSVNKSSFEGRNGSLAEEEVAEADRVPLGGGGGHRIFSSSRRSALRICRLCSGPQSLHFEPCRRCRFQPFQRFGG